MSERHPTLVPDAPVLRLLVEVRWRAGPPRTVARFDPPLSDTLPPELEGLRRRLLEAVLEVDPHAQTASDDDCDDTDTDADTDGDGG